MKVYLEENSCLVKDNNLKSQFVQKKIGYKKELNYYLDFFESYYLFLKKKIKIIKKEKEITETDFLKICEKKINNFDNKFLIFKEFTDLGYIVKDGLSFGFDFRVYNRTKNHSHTLFVVDVKESHTKENLVELIKSERLATTINTKYILAIIDQEKKITKIKIEKN